MTNFLHEWHMRRKIKAILAYNKKHPEQRFNLGDYINKQGIGNMHAQDLADFVEKLKAGSSLTGGGNSNG